MAKDSKASKKDERLFGGLDIGGTKLYTLITDANGKILGKGKKKTKPEVGFEGVMKRAVACLEEACKDAKVECTALTALGVGSPSPILEDGTAIFAPNLDWHDVPLGQTLAEATGLPVFPENDVNAGTYGEYVLGAGKGAKTLVGLFPGTGLGGGIVYHGEILRGENRMAVEIGHMIVVANGRRCGCGHCGCLEAYASKTGMGKRFSHEIDFCGRDSTLIKSCNGTYDNIKSSILAKAYEAKDAVAVETLHEAADYLGIGVGNMITLLGPDVVVIGGGVFEALGDKLIDRVRAAAAAVTLPEASFKDTKIELAKLADDAVALGAMMVAKARVDQA
jgi:glucokinase